LLYSVHLAGQPVADRLVDDAKDDRVQGATGEQQLMKALAYLYQTTSVHATRSKYPDPVNNSRLDTRGSNVDARRCRI